MALFCCWPYATQAVVVDVAPDATSLRKIKDSVLAMADMDVARNPFRFVVAEPVAKTPTTDADALPSKPKALQRDTFRLDATMVSSRKSGAIINDHYYAEGDRVDHPTHGDVRLIQVAADQVTLSAAGQQLTLRYSVPKPPADPPAARPVAKTPTPAASKQLTQQMARLVRERHEGGKSSTLADLLFRSSRIANDLLGESTGGKEQP